MARGPFIIELADTRFDDAAAALSGERGFVCIDARNAPPSLARHSIITANPVSSFSMAGAFVTVDGHTTIDSPHAALSRFSSRIENWESDPYLPFNGGLIGYIGFEAAKALRGFAPAKGFSRHPQSRIGIYDTAVVFDKAEGTSFIVANGEDFSASRRKAYLLAEKIEEGSGRPSQRTDTRHSTSVRMTPDETEFRKIVEIARSWIRSDITSRIHLVRHAAEPLSRGDELADFLGEGSSGTVRALFRFEGSCYSFSSGDAVVDLRGDDLSSRFRVGRASSVSIEGEILKSLSTICDPGSVVKGGQSPAGEGVVHFTGKLGRGFAPIDVVVEMLPTHAATGTPYVRALDFIGQNEETHRAFYGGGFGIIGPTGCTFRTIEMVKAYADGAVRTTVGVDMDENSDVDEINRRLLKKFQITNSRFEI